MILYIFDRKFWTCWCFELAVASNVLQTFASKIESHNEIHSLVCSKFILFCLNSEVFVCSDGCILVARHASHVFVISEQLKRYVHEHFDVPEYRIGLLPNCVDPHRFEVPLLDAVEPLTIAYAGSLIEYEGLDTLLQAVAVLGANGIRCQLNIAGDGEARPALDAMVAQLGIEGHVRFFGKLSPDAARQVIARAAMVCIPRKPYQVCKIVPPIKLLEALAMAKPVIVPDLPVFRDDLGSESPALFFRSGDVQDLARVLKEAFDKPFEMRAFGLRAPAYVEQHRTWAPHVHSVLDTIDRLVNEKQGDFKC